MTISSNFSRLIAATGVVGMGALVSPTAHADANWIMGTVQTAAAGTYFTEIAVTYTVPGPPTSGNSHATSSLWPGLENSAGDLIQPVLAFNEGAAAGQWSLHNEVARLGGKTGIDDGVTVVNPGDQIVVVIVLDTSSPGSSCNLKTGTNCNYESVWADFTLGVSQRLSHDFNMATPPIYAMGMVFEAPGITYNSCSDFPVGGFESQASLYKYTSSNTFAAVTTNFTQETPGATFPFSFTNQPLNNGGNAFPTCMNITYPLGQSNETMMWLNAF